MLPSSRMPRIAAVTVTGSMRAGSAVAATAGKALKKSLLELGGADPFIVLADADIDRAVQVGIEARYQNAGQVCLAAKRFILERPIADEFTRKFVQSRRESEGRRSARPGRRRSGRSLADDLRDGVHDQVEHSIASGARLLLGGKKSRRPRVLLRADRARRTSSRGWRRSMRRSSGRWPRSRSPRTPSTPSGSPIRASTGSAAIYGRRTLEKARAIARRLETGGVFINGFSASNPRIPVGGIKKSGYGRELSHFGLREFTNAQAVWVKKIG